MNKKIFFLILLAVVIILPLAVNAQTVSTTMFDNIKNAAITVGGTIVVIGWIIAGILYLTAAGSPDKLGVAKKALMAAVIGTALIILATGAKEAIDTLLKTGT